MGGKNVFDPGKVVLVMDHFVPSRDVESAETVKALREFAPWAIQGAGISCVVAKSFARIFFRNAINIALPLLESPEAAEGTEDGDSLEIDLLQGEIRNLSRGKTIKAAPYPDFIRELVEYARRLLGQTGKPAGE